MDTSEGLELAVVGGSGAADGDCSTPGSIVWVRRRNGSWWPGKILGPDELSPTHIMSPRSGTPVKLLGREDASVDWYNLEKSKRVKAFRCGDFDECIDKAEKSLGVPIKKREKYARREDAILHALELEREQLEKTQKKLVKANPAGSRKSTVVKRELATSSVRLGNGDDKFVNHGSHSPTKGLEDHGNPIYSQKGKHAKQWSCEEDKSKVMPRMRGLQDFGLRIAPKRKAIASGVSEGSRRPISVDNHDHPLRSGNRNLGGAGSVISSKTLLPFKRKINQSGLVEESSVKRRDRRRPLHQVLQSSAKLPSNNTLQSDGDVSPSMQVEQELSGVVCRAKRSRCVYLPAESNGSLDHTAYRDEMQIIPSQFGVDNCHVNPGSLTEETTTSGLMDETESDSSTSDSDTDEEHAVLSDSLQRRITPGANGFIQRQTESMSSEEEDLDQPPMSHPRTRPHSQWQLKGKRNIRNQPEKRPNGFSHDSYLEQTKPNYSNRRVNKQSRLEYDYADEVFDEMPSLRNRTLDSDEDPVWEPEAPYRTYYHESIEEYDHVLVDVELKVQASYQGSHVPLVSLMSRLNGKAIIGHPVQVEAIEDTSGGVGCDVFEESPLPPVWRTARRTAMQRIPRPPLATLCGDDVGVRRTFKKPVKKVSLSSQKTRTLSSIGVEQGGKKIINRSRVDGLIRPENGPTTVTCIPVKLVFSRLLEAVGRPPRPKKSLS